MLPLVTIDGERREAGDTVTSDELVAEAHNVAAGVIVPADGEAPADTGPDGAADDPPEPADAGNDEGDDPPGDAGDGED